MTTKNDITNQPIKTGANSNAYRENIERIYGSTHSHGSNKNQLLNDDSLADDVVEHDE